MENFNLFGVVRKMLDKKVKVGVISGEFIGILKYCDVRGNIELLTDNGYAIIQQKSWTFITEDFEQPIKNKKTYEELN